MGNINKLLGKFHFIYALKVVVRARVIHLRYSCTAFGSFAWFVNFMSGKRDLFFINIL